MTHATDAPMNRYLATIESRYPAGSPGYDDITARVGYYVTAKTVGDAAVRAAEAAECLHGEVVDVRRGCRDGWARSLSERFRVVIDRGLAHCVPAPSP